MDGGAPNLNDGTDSGCGTEFISFSILLNAEPSDCVIFCGRDGIRVLSVSSDIVGENDLCEEAAETGLVPHSSNPESKILINHI